jgi:hypothetical protein
LKIVNRKSSIWLVAVIWAFWLLQPPIAGASQNLPCLNKLSSADALLVADHDGQIISLPLQRFIILDCHTDSRLSFTLTKNRI